MPRVTRTAQCYHLCLLAYLPMRLLALPLLASLVSCDTESRQGGPAKLTDQAKSFGKEVPILAPLIDLTRRWHKLGILSKDGLEAVLRTGGEGR